MARKSRKNVEAEPVCATALNTALYIRLSVEDGKGRSNSIENQQLILNDYVADKPEFRIFDTYIDNGLTGTNFDRPSFKRMLSDIENGKINCVIVKDLSRLGRNSIDTGFYIEQYFTQHKVRFIAVNDMFDTADENNAQNAILLPLKNMVNEAYALDIGKKIKASAHQAMLDGEYIGARAPFGYKKSPDDCHKLIIDEDTAPIVRQIFEWAAGGMGLNTISVQLNMMNVDTASVHKSKTSEHGKKYVSNRNWTSFAVDRILSSPVYTGDMVQSKSQTIEHKQQFDISPEDYIVVQNTHEPIISREMFAKVQEIRATVRKEYKNKPLDPYNENIFKGKVYCSHCGRHLNRVRAKRKTKADIYRFYCISPSRISKDACVGVLIQERIVIDYISLAIKERFSSIRGSLTETIQADEAATLEKEKAAKQRELNRVQGLVKGLYESLVSGVISSIDYEEFKLGYVKQVDELKQDMERIDSKIKRIKRERDRQGELESCADSFKREKRLTADLINRLIERIEISHDHEINVIFKSEETEGV